MKSKPLKGKRVLLTKAEEESSDFIEILKAAGAGGECLPCFVLSKIPFQVPDLKKITSILFTSANAVNYFCDEVEIPKGIKIGAIGNKTAKSIEKRGYKVDFISDKSSALEFGKLVPKNFGPNVLFPCSKIASGELEHILSDRNFKVIRLEVYSNRFQMPTEKEVKFYFKKDYDFIAFTSPSSVGGLTKIMQDYKIKTKAKPIAIGSTTKAVLDKMEWDKTIVARETSIESMVDAMIKASEK